MGLWTFSSTFWGLIFGVAYIWKAFCVNPILNGLFDVREGERGGVRGHFGMSCSYESTFYCGTAAFYGMKISWRVKKLLRFEGQPWHVFSIQIYRGNFSKIWCFLSMFFYFLTFHVQKLF